MWTREYVISQWQFDEADIDWDKFHPSEIPAHAKRTTVDGAYRGAAVVYHFEWGDA